MLGVSYRKKITTINNGSYIDNNILYFSSNYLEYCLHSMIVQYWGNSLIIDFFNRIRITSPLCFKELERLSHDRKAI